MQRSRIPMFSRRRFVFAGGATLSGGFLRGQQTTGPLPHVHGPKVFLNYDQVELDAAYNQASYAPNMQQVQARYASNSEMARIRLGAPMRAAYGPGEGEALDIYRTEAGNAAVHIFVHGGAWRRGYAKNYGFLAEPFVASGAHCIVPDFAGVEDTGGNLGPIVEQVRRAIAWTYRNAAMFGGDPARIYLSAQSSGGHLSGCALVADWKKEYGVPDDVLKGALLISGMYDLKGPRLSSRSSYVKFDDAIEEALSPQRHIDRIHTPLIVAYASLDTPEFQRQSREFAEAVKAAGKPVEVIRGEGYNHFEFLETMANPYGILGRAALGQMRLARV
jgi:arylformamidase